MPKDLLFGTEARTKMMIGVAKLAKAVASTLGPKGRNVICQRQYGQPMVTKDGVSVAKEIDLTDPIENLGATLVKEVASKTNEVAGDGTTTATVLAHAIAEEGMRLVTAGIDPQALRRGIEKSVDVIVAKIAEIATPVAGDAIEQVACIAANDKVLGKTIADAMKEVGENGVITVEEGNSLGIEVEIVDGMKMNSGYVSPFMATNMETMESVATDTLILVTDQKLRNAMEFLPIAEKLIGAGKKELVVIADDIEGDMLATLIVNRQRGIMNVLAIKAPGYGDRKKEHLSDIAAITGATVISPDTGHKLENVTLDQLGSAHRVVADRNETIIVGGAGDKQNIADRIANLKKQLEEDSSEWNRKPIEQRIAALSGGAAIIKVGAASEVEMKEVKHRIEDAVAATRAAVEEGTVVGGGVALIKAKAMADRSQSASSALVGDEKFATEILDRALEAPLRIIAENAGKNGGTVVDKVKTFFLGDSYGYNAATDTYEDLVLAGVIDPAKVTRCALQNAASVAVMLLTTEASITDVVKEDKK